MKKNFKLLLVLLAFVLFVPTVKAASTVDCGSGSPKAQIGSNCYATLDDAIKSAGNSATIKLLDNVSGYTLKISKDQTITLDLDTHILSAPGGSGWAVYNEGILTITNGTVKGNTGSAAIRNNGIKLTVRSATVESNYIAIINNDVLAIDGTEQETGQPELVLEDSTIKGTFGSCGLQLSGKSSLKNVNFDAGRGNILLRVVDGKTETEAVLDDLSTNNRGVMSAGKNSTNPEHGVKVEIKNIDPTAKSKIALSPEGDAIVYPDNTFADKLLQYALEGATVVLPEGFTIENAEVNEGVTVTTAGGQVIEKNDDGTYNILERADYSKIDNLIEKVEGLDSSNYTKESWKSLEDVIATIDYNKSSKEQDEVDALAVKLEKAINDLVKVKEVANPKTSDPAIIYMIIAGVALVGLVIGGLYLIKLNKRHNN